MASRSVAGYQFSFILIFGMRKREERKKKENRGAETPGKPMNSRKLGPGAQRICMAFPHKRMDVWKSSTRCPAHTHTRTEKEKEGENLGNQSPLIKHQGTAGVLFGVGLGGWKWTVSSVWSPQLAVSASCQWNSSAGQKKYLLRPKEIIRKGSFLV